MEKYELFLKETQRKINRYKKDLKRAKEELQKELSYEELDTHHGIAIYAERITKFSALIKELEQAKQDFKYIIMEED